MRYLRAWWAAARARAVARRAWCRYCHQRPHLDASPYCSDECASEDAQDQAIH